jgi:hypothetical protein
MPIHIFVIILIYLVKSSRFQHTLLSIIHRRLFVASLRIMLLEIILINKCKDGSIEWTGTLPPLSHWLKPSANQTPTIDATPSKRLKIGVSACSNLSWSTYTAKSPRIIKQFAPSTSVWNTMNASFRRSRSYSSLLRWPVKRLASQIWLRSLTSCSMTNYGKNSKTQINWCNSCRPINSILWRHLITRFSYTNSAWRSA